MKKLWLIFFLITCLSGLLSARETTIYGQIPGGRDFEIRLIGYSDLISYSEILLDRTIIDPSDEFVLRTDITETQITYLDLDYYSATLYLEPGKEYRIQFDSVSMEEKFRPFYEKEQLIFRIYPDDPNELNRLIFDFNESLNSFLLNNFSGIYNHRNKNIIEDFRHETKINYTKIENPFFEEFINYKIATIEESVTGSIYPELLFKKYFSGKQILYTHPAYMEFFNRFFEHYLTNNNKFIPLRDLETGINERSSYPALMDSLGKDTMLLSESIRELVLIKSLKELFFSTDYQPQNILQILHQIIEMSHFPIHKAIAKNVSESLTRLQKGTYAPEPNLADLSGKPIKFNDFSGKPVYVSFLVTWTHACLAEYKILDSLYAIWGNEIEFITVSLDHNIDIISKFKREKNYQWTFLYNGTGYDAIHAYGIKTFPLFVLIDTQGNILQYPAIKPSEGIGETFSYLQEKSKE